MDSSPTIHRFPSQPDRPVRGVAWVVRWASAWATIVFTAALLAEFGYCLRAEQQLARAARAGALEATLPRASYESVREVVSSRVSRYGIPKADARLTFEHNGAAILGKFQPSGGDRVAVTLTVSSRAVLPRWLQALRPWGETPIIVRVERRLPGPIVPPPQRAARQMAAA